MPALFTDHEVAIYMGLAITLVSIVTLTTIARLYIKGTRKWWWDDLWVVLGVLVMLEQQGVIWALSTYKPPTLPVAMAVVMSSATQVWCARASILASVLRIAPTNRAVLIARIAGGLFLIFYLITIAQIIWVCGGTLKLNLNRPHCLVTKQLPAYQFTAAMISDAILIALPLHTLRLLKSEPKLRRRLRVIFAASAITTCTSFTNALMNFLDQAFGLFIAAELECWVSLFVCSLGVILSPLFRRFARHEDSSYNVSGFSLSVQSQYGSHAAAATGTKTSIVRLPPPIDDDAEGANPIELGKLSSLRSSEIIEENVFPIGTQNGNKV